jgi:enamine deaminase RidA (YjgF/YER057c/UK114 family)
MGDHVIDVERGLEEFGALARVLLAALALLGPRGRDDAAAQATYILDKIAASILSLGGRLDDVVRTRVYLSDASDWQDVSAVHGRYFGDIRPANTLLQVGALIGEGYRVEIEAEAVTVRP